MEHLTSTIQDQRAGDIQSYLNHCRISYLQPHRVVKVFLHCDESVSTPVATTRGDSQVILNYVCKLTVLLPCQYI